MAIFLPFYPFRRPGGLVSDFGKSKRVQESQSLPFPPLSFFFNMILIGYAGTQEWDKQIVKYSPRPKKSETIQVPLLNHCIVNCQPAHKITYGILN